MQKLIGFGLLLSVTLNFGCAAGSRSTGSRDGGSLPMDGSPARLGDGEVRNIPDVGPNPDAFFADDPPPMSCFPDGGSGPAAEPPGGTPDCPDDKNREGCRCEGIGETADCWPGLRVNRNRGVCHDGTTTCEIFDEFTGRWGPCTGYVLPAPDAVRGPGACRCFSAGRWEIDNLSPCFIAYSSGTEVYAVSTYVDPADGLSKCPSDIPPSPPPSPQPGTDWSTDRLTIDCEGRFELCYTIKAGDADTPTSSDCTVMRTCVETWYAESGVAQELPPLPAWTSTDPVCTAQFRDSGGYGEMSVRGLSIECDPVDDGSAAEYVFNRVNYCPTICNTEPTRTECVMCCMGGSGSF